MHVTRLDIRRLRRFDEVQLLPSPGLNLITGDNGAGKTSVLEALHLMAYGRSFRARVRDGLIRHGDEATEVFVEWRERRAGTVQTMPGTNPGANAEATSLASTPPGRPDTTGGPSGEDREGLPAGSGLISDGAERTRRAGLRHSGRDWEGRLDGRPVSQLGDLCAALAVVSFEPGSHALITGAAENRRRYLDWGLFHVEQHFLPLWRRYARALRQRNALLKSRAGDEHLDAWDRELAEAGEPLSQYRQRYLDAIEPGLARLAADLAPSLGTLRLEYQPGWRREDFPLVDALLFCRERDRLAGFTSVGPHRADWRIGFGALPGREALSRGQAKLTALAALLAQAEHHAAICLDWPVIGLDDLASELDRQHQARVLDWVRASGAQAFITGTEVPPGLAASKGAITLFHVEHGMLQRLE
ncbi:recombinase RecF [Lysobacter daejeonensis GH1-9]|uniref:DNA replication and repair protein RecF n=1 Tax=Lysobacter daejeonensis GH1-9 TaxID=1385517 RepID=A0A0A0ETI7_9GAMM|nr:DNA replication/repair protein RecF [Lysobacter daejeonensis]KGM53418.1 recombinase RecF [Lysobacter daejeonensis GH1-9]